MPVTTRRHFLTDAAIYGVGGIAMQLASIILLPLYTRFLDPSDYGVLNIIERVGHMTTVLLMSGGVRQASMAFYLQAKEDSRRSRVAVTITALLLLIYVLGGICIAILAPVLGPLLGIADLRLLVFGVLVVLLGFFTTTPLTLMQARIESKAFISWSLLMLIVKVAAVVLFVAALGLGVWGVYYALCIVFLGFGVTLTIREIRRGSARIDRKMALEIARFGLPFIPTGMLGFVLYNSDRFFLVGAAGTAALGVYALGHRLAGAIGVVSTAPLFKVWTAKMYGVFEQAHARFVVGRMFTRIMTVYSAAGVLLCLFHPEVLALLSSDAYQGAGAVIAPLVLANGFMFAYTFFEGVFYAFHRTRYKPVTAAVGAGAMLGACALLIPRYSILGAAYALLVGYFAMALVTYLVAQRVFSVKYEFGRLGMLLCISVACYLPSTGMELGLRGFLAKILLFLLWASVVWFGRILHSDDKVIALSAVRRVWKRLRA